MIWPWSKFRRLEAEATAQRTIRERAEARAAALDAALTAERERVDRLTETIVEMRRDGFQSAPRPPEVPDEPELPPEVEAALREVPDVAGLRGWADLQLAQDVPAEQVAAMIRRGGRSEV